MTHILENVFDEDPDSNLHKSMVYNDIKSPIDLCAQNEDQLGIFEYPTDAQGSTARLAIGDISLLKSFKRFVAYKATMGQPIDDAGWMTITQQDFDDFGVGRNNLKISPTASQPHLVKRLQQYAPQPTKANM